jgi:hypothetical protein
MPYIRFCGGPWHNRIEDIQLTQAVILRAKQGVPCGIQTIYNDELYQLAQFHTPFKTIYYQYVHSSLIRGTGVAECCYRERLRPFKISRRECQERLRRAMQWAAETSTSGKKAGGSL